MKKGTFKLLVFLITILILIIAIRLILPKNVEEPKDEGIPIFSPEPSADFNPTFDYLIAELNVLSTNLKGEAVQINGPVIITFNKPVRPGEILYKINPDIKTEATSGASANEFTISPVDSWEFGSEYIITILKGSKSLDGTVLNNDYIVDFKSVKYAGY